MEKRGLFALALVILLVGFFSAQENELTGMQSAQQPTLEEHCMCGAVNDDDYDEDLDLCKTQPLIKLCHERGFCQIQKTGSDEDPDAGELKITNYPCIETTGEYCDPCPQGFPAEKTVRGLTFKANCKPQSFQIGCPRFAIQSTCAENHLGGSCWYVCNAWNFPNGESHSWMIEKPCSATGSGGGETGNVVAPPPYWKQQLEMIKKFF